MSEVPKLRTFVAVELPREARDEVERRAAPFRELSAFRWTPAENLHLTLAFLGWVEPDAVEEIAAALAGAAADVVPFEVRVGGAGGFPERGKARVLWVGFHDPEGDLVALAHDVRDALGRFFPSDDRPFRPHVTIARARRPQRVRVSSSDEPGRAFRVDAITLFRSRLGGEHARYEAIARWPLGAGPARIT